MGVAPKAPVVSDATVFYIRRGFLVIFRSEAPVLPFTETARAHAPTEAERKWNDDVGVAPPQERQRSRAQWLLRRHHFHWRLRHVR